MTDENETIRQAMKILGSRTSEAKKRSSANNAKLSSATKPGRVLSQETRQKMAEAQRKRWADRASRGDSPAESE